MIFYSVFATLSFSLIRVNLSTFLRRIASILDKDVASKKSTHMDGQNNGLFRTLHNHHTRISVWLCVVQCTEADEYHFNSNKTWEIMPLHANV